MKKLLACFSSILLISSSSTMTAACGQNVIQNLSNNQTMHNYELFDKTFESKETAINYYLNNEVVKEESTDYSNEILLGQNNFSNLTDMYNDIDKSNVIKETTTLKNPENHKVNSLEMLDENILTNKDDLVTVYKDINGNAIYNGDNESSLKKAKDSYNKQIVKLYQAEGKDFNNKDEIVHYYNSKYEESDKPIPSEENYKFGNMWFNKDAFEEQLTRSIVQKVNYNGVSISSENRENLSRVKLYETDLEKIQKLDKSPGIFYFELKNGSEGRLLGDNFVKSSEDLSNIFFDKSKWEKTEDETSSILDVLFDAAVSAFASQISDAILIGYIANIAIQPGDIKSMQKMIEVLLNRHDQIFTDNSYSNNYYSNQFENLLKKYGIFQKISQFWSDLESTELTMNQKTIISLFNLREELRQLDVSNEDMDYFKDVVYKVLLPLNINMDSSKKTFDSSDDKWIEIVESAKETNIMMLLDYLVEPSTLQNAYNVQYSSDLKKQLIDFVNYQKDKMGEYEELLDTLYNTLDNVKEIMEKLKKIKAILSWVGAVLELLDSIPVQKSITYQFVIPDTRKTLKYQKTSWIWEKDNFDPSSLFNLIVVKKPMNNELYLYNEKYFNNKDTAIEYLKKDIINDLFSDPANIIFTTKYFPNIESNNITDLKKKIFEAAEHKVSYNDGFGNLFDNPGEAKSSLLSKIKNDEYKQTYKFTYNNLTLYNDNKEELIKTIDSLFEINNKVVEFSDLLSNHNFDELEDLSGKSYLIYYIEYNGKTYYFSSKLGAVEYYLKLKNYINIVIETKNTTYKLNDKVFSNINEYTHYLYNNIIEKEVNNA